MYDWRVGKYPFDFWGEFKSKKLVAVLLQIRKTNGGKKVHILRIKCLTGKFSVSRVKICSETAQIRNF
jgi:hypothetical protein